LCWCPVYMEGVLCKVCIWFKWPIGLELIPSFCSMKQLGVFLLPPGWNASPSQGYTQHSICRLPFIHLGGERHCESSVLPRNTMQCPRPGLEPRPLDPEMSALMMGPKIFLFSLCRPHLNTSYSC